MPAESVIDISSITHFDDRYNQFPIVNLIEDAVVSCSDPENSFEALQFLNAWLIRIFGKRINSFNYQIIVLSGKLV